ncbi:hypothetical protein [Flaviflexus massiliensis]|uniref:hypothetical protein n=1 Tax=Flaviflexus massiliensis TaxID=1522309 RepID=UPI000AFA8863|nr:hypothetical protein [Flaviflexus massiliensis]
MSAADLRAENARLRRELAQARLDNEFFVKATPFCEATRTEKFELIQQEKANYSIKRMAHLLKLSRPRCYTRARKQQHRLSGKDDREACYDDGDRKIHKI